MRSKLLCFTEVAGYTHVTEKGKKSLKGKISRKWQTQLLIHVLLLQERTYFCTYATVLWIFRSNRKTLQIISFHSNKQSSHKISKVMRLFRTCRRELTLVFPFLFLFSICLQIFKSLWIAWITLSSFSTQVQGIFKMKAEILVHSHEPGLRVLRNAPTIAALAIIA